jgi:hypothetical protein
MLYLAVLLYSLWIPQAMWARQGETVGVPWVGDSGLPESVWDIMARRDVAESERPPGLRTDRRGHHDRSNLPENPNAPKVSNWPPAGLPGLKDELMDVQEAKTDATPPSAPQSFGTNVIAATLSTSGFIPPDSMGAVGPTQIVVPVNGRIRTLTKAGALDGIIDTTTNNFFNSVRNASTTSDPRVVFDRLSQRWFIVMINTTSPNRVLLAVSSGATITGTSSFTFFQFQHDLVGPTPNADTGGFADQPSLGVDNNGLYIGVNVFNAAGTAFLGSTGFVINRANLIGGSLVVTPFRQLSTGSTAGPFAPLGVTNMNPSATEGYFIGVDTLVFSTLQIRRVSNPGGIPSISSNITLTVPATTHPRTVPAQGSSPLPLDGNDDRLINAQIMSGSLWTAHGIQVNSSGVASSTGGRDGMRFYEIINLTTTPSLRQSGTLFDPAASNPLFFWMGSIATSGQGHTALGASFAAAAPFNGGTINGYAGVAFSGRLAGDALGTLNPTINLNPGGGAYNVERSSKRGSQRWGDYSNVVVDPTDNMTMWSFQEMADTTNSWGVLVTQLQAPPPATPSSASPPSAARAATLNVTITGTSSSGSGFFDPGSAFQNRIAAAVNGGGVTVNSVTYANPTSITLNLTIAGGAATGSRTVTVTNPDGQSATSVSSIFTVTGAILTLSPSTLPNGTVGVSYNQTITASGGSGPYTFSIAAGALPTGLTLNGPTGAITGTPSNAGTANFTVGALDSVGNTGSQPYVVKIAGVVSNNVSLPVISTSYDPTPSPGFTGRFTINTTLTNNGPDLSSPFFFKITTLSKNGTDQNPAQPDKLLSADNGTGTVGDIQTLPIGGLSTGAFTPVSFLVGIGSRQSFSLFLDLYAVPPGSALTALDNEKLAGLNVSAATLLGHFQFDVSESSAPVGPAPPTSDLTIANPLNVGIITGPGPQSRPVAAVDPILPNRLAIASNNYQAGTVSVSTTEDRGKTWHATTLSRSLGNQQFFIAHNPSLAFDSLGKLSVVYTLSNLNDSATAIVISESSDGVTFSPPSAISFHLASDQIIDSRPVIAIRSGGRYVAWDSFSNATGQYSIKLARSPQGGLFDSPVSVVSNGLLSSPALAVSERDVYVGWDDWGFNSRSSYNAGGRLMMTSTPVEGRINFSTPQEIARTNIGFAQRIGAMPEKGAAPNLSLAVDPKKDDLVYAVFADKGNGLDILMTRSANGGKSWQQTRVVNDDAGLADQFDPAIAVDPDGNINISFYDTRLSSTFTAADVFIARSSKSNRFDNLRISSVASNDSLTNLLRDYTANLGGRTAIAITQGDLVIAWTDTRQGSEDIFLSIVEVPKAPTIED